MKTVATLRAADVHPAEPLARWYMPGIIDGFGDRLLMIDNAASDALELLRFRPALRDTPGFEDALHDGVRQLGRLAHPRFPAIRGVERFERDGSLVLVSISTPGQRLSQFLDERQSDQGLYPPFVIWMVSQILDPLSVLHAEGDEVAHTALTADRIILAPDGSVRVVEHVLGAALRHLDCSPARLWQEFGILALCDDTGRPRLDGRGDVFQLGVVALSMLLARRITRGDVDHRLASLLDHWSESARSQVFHEPIRRWLERALQIGDGAYQSAADAHADLRELPLLSAARVASFLQTGGVESGGGDRVIPRPTQDSVGWDAQKPRLSLTEAVDASGSLLPITPTDPAETALTVPVEVSARAVTPAVPSRSRALRIAIRVAIAAAIVAQGAVIAMLLTRQTRAPAASLPAALPLPATPLEPTEPDSDGTAASIGDLVSSAAPAAADPSPAVALRADAAAAAAIARALQNQKFGGVRLSAPIELKVLQGDRVLGSSAGGPIVTSGGTHDLELINTELGFHVRQTITFRAGEITTVAIPVGPGRININAAPWAEVSIDGRPVGETPLANVEIPLGEHEIVFRHPNLGERRQRVVVRADAVARVTTTFDR